ncbi:hypothetical protein Tco_1284942 [Tanacetum coccineum]
MAFVATMFSSRYPPINNQLRTLSNPRNQATIQDGRVTLKTIQGRQTHEYANNGARNAATTQMVDQGANINRAVVQQWVLSVTTVKRKAILLDNIMGIQSLKLKHLKKSQLQAAFQTDDLDAFDSDCDDVPLAKAVLMANLFSYDSDVLSESYFVNDTKVDITSDSNIISYEQYLQETVTLVVQSTSSSAQQDALLMSVIEELSSQVAKSRSKAPTLYDGHTILKTHVALLVIDTEEILELAEENKKYFEIEKKELSLNNDHLLEHIICQDVKNVVMHANDHHDNVLLANNNALAHDNSALDFFVDEYEENLKLHFELDKKNDMIEKAVYNELSKRSSRLENRYQLEATNVSIAKLKEYIAILKGKNTVESVQNVHNSNVVTSKVYKLELPPISLCINNNMALHVDYLKHTQATADILHEIVKDAKELRPLYSNLASTCQFVTRIQELLVYVSATCPRVSCPTKASGSKPRSNTKNDRIPQTSCTNKKKMWKPTEAVNTACYTQNRSLICLCEDLGKLKAKSDIGIFVGYSYAKKAFRIYNKRNRLIMETIHVMFDELTAMAYEQFSSRLAPQDMTPGTLCSGVVPNLIP